MSKLITACTTLMFAVAMSPLAASAQNGGSAGTGPNPFTDCGIGAALFPDTHWAAVTSNVIWDVGTTAVISATASPETCEGSSAQAAKFINDAYDSVVEDTARGDGEYLQALLQIYGCSSDAHEPIVESVRKDIGAVVADEAYASKSRTDRAEDYFKVVDATVKTSFSGSCTA